MLLIIDQEQYMINRKFSLAVKHRKAGLEKCLPSDQVPKAMHESSAYAFKRALIRVNEQSKREEVLGD